MKLSAREKTLATVVGGVVFLLLNLALFSALAKKNDALRMEMEQRRSDWSAMKELMGEEGLWEARDAALTARQPKLENENAAGVELFDSLRQLAKNCGVTPENPVISEEVVNNGFYRSVSVSLDTESSWSNLVAFLYALQKPDQFLVCEAATINVDPADQTKMAGHFKIARWYAP